MKRNTGTQHNHTRIDPINSLAIFLAGEFFLNQMRLALSPRPNPRLGIERLVNGEPVRLDPTREYKPTESTNRKIILDKFFLFL